MTAREQHHADNIIREIEARKAHRYRVLTVVWLLAAGLVSWAMVYLMVRSAGVQ
jgi:hypothetical protein